MGKRPDTDYFRTLGVGRDADEEELRAAFRRLARVYHPDVGTSGDADRFRRIREAYEVLSDSRRRADHISQLDGTTVTVRFASGRARTPPAPGTRPTDRTGGRVRDFAADFSPRHRPQAHLDLSRSPSGEPVYGSFEDELEEFLLRFFRFL